MAVVGLGVGELVGDDGIVSSGGAVVWVGVFVIWIEVAASS